MSAVFVWAWELRISGVGIPKGETRKECSRYRKSYLLRKSLKKRVVLRTGMCLDSRTRIWKGIPDCEQCVQHARSLV